MRPADSVTPGVPVGLVFDLARVTIELSAPLGIGSGYARDLEDRPCVLDASGLPAIPGSSLAGVLRSAICARRDPVKAEQAFGYQAKDKGSPSRIEVSWGHVHDSENSPAATRVTTLDDPLLMGLRIPVVRDHVRIDGFGAGAEHGKYDESLVPRGARFTFEVVVHDGSPVSLAEIVSLLRGGKLRLGGGTRRGHGAFEVVQVRGRRFDLRVPEHRTVFERLPRTIRTVVSSKDLPVVEEASPDAGTPGEIDVVLELRPSDFLLVGQGEPMPPDPVPEEWRVPDIHPVHEPWIQWNQGKGVLQNRAYLVPGTALKGALRHRTAFHAYRLARRFAEAATFADAEPMPPEIALLFGEIKRSHNDEGGEDTGRPGHVFVDDCWFAHEPQRHCLDHVSIDRFSGAPLDGHLFREEALWFGKETPPLRFRLRVENLQLETATDPTGGGDEAIIRRARAAFLCAIRDLCAGRLPIGSAAGRGHGTMTGEVPKEVESWAG